MAEAESNQGGLVGTLRLRGGRRVRPPAQVTAIDIDGPLLRVAVATRRGARAEFSQVAAAPLQVPAKADADDPAVLGKAIAAALETLRLKPSAVAMAIPRGRVILRTITLPALEDVRELAAMVRLQVSKELPYRKEDAVIDFEVRPPSTVGDKASDADSKSGDAPAPAARLEALVAVAQRDVVDFYRNVCAAAGVKLGALTLLPFAHAQALVAAEVAEPDATVAFVVVRHEDVTVDIVRGGKLLFSRDATLVEPQHTEPVPTEPGTEAQEDASRNGKLTPTERITIEVVRSLHAFSGTVPATPVSRIIVSGGTPDVGGTIEALSTRMAIPVTAFDPASLGLADPATASMSTSVAAIAAAATDPAGMAFDFLEPKRPAEQRDMKRIRILAAAAVLVVLVFTVLGFRTYLVRQRERVLQQVTQDTTAITKSQPLFRKTRAQAAGIQAWINEGKDWLQHYAYLSAVLPRSEEIYVTSLSVSAQGTIRLAVQARSGEVLAKLDKQLRDAGYEVKPQAITPGTDRFGYNFKSSVELIAPAKMKIDLSKVKPPPRPADDVSLNPPGKRTAAITSRANSGALMANGGAR